MHISLKQYIKLKLRKLVVNKAHIRFVNPQTLAIYITSICPPMTDGTKCYEIVVLVFSAG